MEFSVSLVVPTYRTNPKHLAALVDSVDRLTLPPGSVELIFVDDGSPDDTFNRLSKLAADRPHTIARQIPHSGWPCRPRNIGTELARGEYVLYLDHDDVLFPDGLAFAYAFGLEHKADVVNLKEARTRGWGWGWDEFEADRPPAAEPHMGALLPMTPHKLYRREFLRDHDIRFEESHRLMWEDIRFNLLALARGARVAVVGSRACYHWVGHETNSSSSYEADPREKWDNLDGLLQYIHQVLPEGTQRDQALLHQHRVRMLNRLGPWMLTATPDRLAFEVGRARELAELYVPAALDASLAPLNRAQAACLRTGDLESARELATIEREIGAPTRTVRVQWQEARLELTIETELQWRGQPLRLTRDPHGRLQRQPDTAVRAALGQDQLDFAGVADAATVQLGLKARDTREDWHAGAACALPLTPSGDDQFVLRGRHTTGIDVISGLFGRPLERQPYDVSISTSVLGRRFHGPASGPDDLVLPALVDGTAVIIYTNRTGGLSIDVGERFRIVAAQAASPGATLKLTRRLAGDVLELGLPDVHVHGATKLPGTLLLTGPDDNGEAQEIAATLIGDDGTARIRSAPAMLEPGAYQVAVRFRGRTVITPHTLTVPAAASLSFMRRLAQAAKRGESHAFSAG